MAFSWKWVSDVADAAANLVDKAFPFWVGQRTKIAAVACPVLGFAAPVVAALYPPAAVAVPIVHNFVCGPLAVATPVFAAAGLLRK